MKPGKWVYGMMMGLMTLGFVTGADSDCDFLQNLGLVEDDDDGFFDDHDDGLFDDDDDDIEDIFKWAVE